MTDFADALRRIDARLHLPQPARSRVILELATDLEALYRHYLDKGLTEDEAREAALSDLDATDEVLTDLAEVHVSAVRRGMDRLVRQAESGWTRALLLVVLVAVAGAAARVVLTPMFVEDAGIFLWPMGLCLGVGAVTGGLLLMRLQRFDADDPAPARGLLDRIAVLIVGEFMLALFGAWMELYWAVGRMVDDAGQITPELFGWLVRASALMSAGVAAALILAVVWFFASHRTAVIEDARAALLMTVPTLGSNNTKREVGDV
jgi:hypothetical protein